MRASRETQRFVRVEQHEADGLVVDVGQFVDEDAIAGVPLAQGTHREGHEREFVDLRQPPSAERSHTRWP